MFRPEKIKQFDALCFSNTVGVLFEDPELKQTLLGFIAGGKGFVGIHDAIATFVQYPKYDQWPAFGQMVGATENGGHPWNGEVMTIKVEDPASPLNARAREFQIATRLFPLRAYFLRSSAKGWSIDVERLVWRRMGAFCRCGKGKDFPMAGFAAVKDGCSTARSVTVRHGMYPLRTIFLWELVRDRRSESR
jgi:hypothetical protein